MLELSPKGGLAKMTRALTFNQTELDQTQFAKVADGYHDTKYFIMGTWGLIGDGFIVYSLTGDPLAEIKQLTIGNNAKFELSIENQTIAIARLHITVLNQEFIYLKHENILVTGNSVTQKYNFFKGRHQITKLERLDNDATFIREITTDQIETEPTTICIAAMLSHPRMKISPHHKMNNQVNYGI